MDLVEIFKQFGVNGLIVLVPSYAAWYFIRWMRELLEVSKKDHAEVRGEFLCALRDQRTEHTASMKEATNDFKDALQVLKDDLGGKIDGVSERVDRLDEHIRGK